MATLKDLTSYRFGLLTVFARGRSRPGGGAYWWCHCDCGADKEIDGYALRRGKTTSCGRACLSKKNPVEIAQKFWDRVNLNGPGGCWLWTGHGTPNGYGNFWNGHSQVFAHKWAWVSLRSDIPEGLELDHLCKIRNCVNPDHMEPVTREENIARSAQTRREKPCCKRGHLFNEENTYWYTAKDGSVHRNCKTCMRIREAARKLTSERMR